MDGLISIYSRRSTLHAKGMYIRVPLFPVYKRGYYCILKDEYLKGWVMANVGFAVEKYGNGLGVRIHWGYTTPFRMKEHGFQ